MIFSRVIAGQTLTVFLWALWLCLTGAGVVHAQSMPEKILPMDGHITPDGQKIELNWFDADPPRVGSVTVKRRLYGEIGGETWETLATGLGPVLRYTDEEIKPGTAYEYQVLRSARQIVDVGYWLAGTELPTQSRRGNAYVIVDETLSAPLGPRLDRFERDLVGDGWQVRRHLVPRHQNKKDKRLENLKAAATLRQWLQARYAEDPFGVHTVVLVGRVPWVRSGRAAPDGHEQIAHASDLFYADMDGRWSLTKKGALLDNRLPGNFIEMQVGRIDFSTVSIDRPKKEIHLLRTYFDKNHHWRNGMLGDLREAYGKNEHLEVELAALRNIVGAQSVTTGTHHAEGTQKPWLWGVNFGDWNAAAYSAKTPIKTIFAINFGSGKQKISRPNNAMVAMMGLPWYPLAVGWGARPAWWLHHMALGGSIGDVHMRTVNNGQIDKPFRETMDYFPTGKYLWRNPVWVNLLGDPTLRAFPLTPASDVRVEQVAEGVQVSWTLSPDEDATGYRVYRAPAESMAFTPLSEVMVGQGTAFLDSAPQEGARYMVRAYGLKKVYAGSFYTYSQGAFSHETPLSETEAAQTLRLVTPVNQPLRLPDVFNVADPETIHAVIAEPERGLLRYDLAEEGWIYTPPEGFAGTVPLRITISDKWRSLQTALEITVQG